MSKTYEQACREVGLDVTKIEPPQQLKHWYGYDGGKAIQCKTPEEAKKYKLSEVVLDPTSKQKIVEFWEARRQLEESALIIFRESVRADYSGMSDGLFDLCYAAAQEWGRTSDHDEIPETIKFFIDFSYKAIKLKR